MDTILPNLFRGRSSEDAPKGRRVLVVEDDALLREMIRGALSSAGHSVTAVENGLEAIECTLAGDIDLVIADLELPSIGGIEMYRQMQAGGRAPKIFVCSGMIKPETRVQLLSAGITHWITKPFLVSELLDMIEHLFRD